MKKAFFFIVALGLGLAVYLSNQPTRPAPFSHSPEMSLFPSLTPTPQPLPSRKLLASDYQVFQTFNNCGPAALSMALFHYGILKSQEELGAILRPYQNQAGDNDDKSVTLEELGRHARTYGFMSFHRPAGTIDLVIRAIAAGYPVITRTWLTQEEDIGHYRVVKGYDEETETLIQDDSLQGYDLTYSYEEFTALWKKFNYEYLILIPQENVDDAPFILGQHLDPKQAWAKAVEQARNELEANPLDTYARFNLSVALYHTDRYEEAVEEFEAVEARLPRRTLWYQIEPIEAYAKLGRNEQVFALTDRILENHNRAFSELYLIRGKIYQKREELDLAREEFEKAVFYNRNLKEAHEALRSIDTF